MKIIHSIPEACKTGKEHHCYADREPNTEPGSLQRTVQHPEWSAAAAEGSTALCH